MIGILRPQSPPSKNNERFWLARGALDKGLDNASRRYLAEHDDGLGARHSSLLGGPQRDGSSVPSPTLLGGECKASVVRRLPARLGVTKIAINRTTVRVCMYVLQVQLLQVRSLVDLRNHMKSCTIFALP